MTVHVLGSEKHYIAHAVPIWHALPESLRGSVYATRRQVRAPDDTIIVAAARDIPYAHGRHVVLVEHGAGQIYGGEAEGHMAYSGGSGRDAVDLFVVPSEKVAARNAARYPLAAQVVAGVPVLDPWHSGERARIIEADLAVMSFHYDERDIGVPEARWAFPHYERGLRDIAAELARGGVRLALHAHPRASWHVQKAAQRHRLPFISDFAEVLDRAAIYIVDNSSTGPEMASTGRPVVWLSAPWYRRDVDHGARFWSWTEGVPHASEPSEVAGLVLSALSGPTEGHRRMVADAYAYTDGLAAERAAQAVVALAAPVQQEVA